MTSLRHRSLMEVCTVPVLLVICGTTVSYWTMFCIQSNTSKLFNRFPLDFFIWITQWFGKETDCRLYARQSNNPPENSRITTSISICDSLTYNQFGLLSARRQRTLRQYSEIRFRSVDGYLFYYDAVPIGTIHHRYQIIGAVTFQAESEYTAINTMVPILLWEMWTNSEVDWPMTHFLDV